MSVSKGRDAFCEHDAAKVSKNSEERRGEGRARAFRGQRRQGGPAGSLGEHSDHIVALRWSDPLPGMLFTVDLILHKEMALLLQVGATVGTHVTLRVAVTVTQLHKHATAGGGRKRAPLVLSIEKV